MASEIAVVVLAVCLFGVSRMHRKAIKRNHESYDREEELHRIIETWKDTSRKWEQLYRSATAQPDEG